MTNDEKIKFTAPVVTDSQTEKGVASFLNAVKLLQSQPNTVWANAESERLDHYFAAMSRYLTHVIEHDADINARYKQKDFRKMTTSKGLKKLYNDMAVKSQNCLISEVAIIPNDMMMQGPAAHLFKAQENFNIGFDYDGHQFDFGFLRVFEENGKSATTIPIFTVDHRMVNAVHSDVAGALLDGLQKTMTYVNHDVLHHLSMPVINAEVVQKYDNVLGMESTLSWQIKSRGVGAFYEEWTHIAHEVILKEDNLDHLRTLNESVDRYFDTLSLLSENDISKDFAHGETHQHKHQAVIDYYGTVMLHTLSRAFSFDHPVMIQAIKRMEDIDPMPEKIVEKCVKHMLFNRDIAPEKIKTAIRDLLFEEDIDETMPSDIIKGYKNAGFEIFPSRDDDVGYAHFKMAQLIGIGYMDVFSHVPSDQMAYIGRLRKNMGQEMFRMVEASAIDAGVMKNPTQTYKNAWAI